MIMTIMIRISFFKLLFVNDTLFFLIDDMTLTYYYLHMNLTTYMPTYYRFLNQSRIYVFIDRKA